MVRPEPLFCIIAGASAFVASDGDGCPGGVSWVDSFANAVVQGDILTAVACAQSIDEEVLTLEMLKDAADVINAKVTLSPSVKEQVQAVQGAISAHTPQPNECPQATWITSVKRALKSSDLPALIGCAKNSPEKVTAGLVEETAEAMLAIVAYTSDELQKRKLSDSESLAANLYLYFCACLVFLMQLGFGMLEAGSVGSKNTKNILLKNLLDACLGAIIWWAWGMGTEGA